ncbi:MAG: hypothetical protein P4L74_07475 [Candidatus Doudnabacteria bacterium]|nr:hypothetical protein [Candidatus Doudnabacteria bacterium]
MNGRTAGFTLIEVLLYIAFFAFLMGSLLGVTFQTMASAAQINKKISLEQESNFILNKLEWALADAQNVLQPGVNSGSAELGLNRYAAADNPVEFTLRYGYLNMTLAGAPAGPETELNSANIIASDFTVNASQVPGFPEKIEISLTLACAEGGTNPQTYRLVKYLRQ